jgi:hypothetical protein
MDSSLIAQPINFWHPRSPKPLRTTFSWSPDQPLAAMGRSAGAVKVLQLRAVRRLAQLVSEDLR